MTQKTHPRIYDSAGKQLPVSAKSWYFLQASGEAERRTIEVYVYGEIGGWGITANQFVQDLRGMDDGVSPIVVAFNSGGGDLFDGLAMHNALSRLGERCTGRVDALAASAASVAVCGAHRVVIAANAMLMIHNPWTYTSGDADDFRRVADVLDQTLEAIIAAYKAKAPNVDDAELRRLVNAETWLTATEAVELGLADEIGGGIEVKACVGQGAVLHRYRHAPQALMDLIDGAEEPVAETEPQPQPPAQVSTAKLALMITQGCAEAGISNLIEPLINSTQLADEPVVQAALTRAKAVRDLCVAARLPELTEGFVRDGLDTVAVRARLFDTLTGSGGFEIDNSLPLADDSPIHAQARQPNPQGIWASRRNAQSTNKPAQGARQ
ncbi:head maturation protease, ClpP-related [Pseudomonas sp. SLFW]|uniref:head maturation protease, ClpP-related n=1 Tax=Pseudomonas sp. SLFW TaxID=2683259 RepID=UPI0014133B0E|nr:head maturation protease, ClpP-related [Pseudomonas sp. SLFW]NBB09548.1 Clp protease ClpP [Pseudomonas sp. SLFW]